MGMFYRFVAAAMYGDPLHPDPRMMGPYAAVFVFAVGVFLSNFVWNTLAMKKPFVGTPVSFASYFQGDFRTHLTGILGGCIWGIGMSLNLIASGPAGFAISYGLGQGATMLPASASPSCSCRGERWGSTPASRSTWTGSTAYASTPVPSSAVQRRSLPVVP